MNQYNPYEMQPDNQFHVPAKKKPGFGLGFLTGGLLCTVVLITAVYLIAYLTGFRFVIGNGGVQKVENTQVLDEATVDKISELMSYIDMYYYEDIEAADLQESIYKGMVDGLGDKYAAYYSKDDYADFQISSTGKYYGIGAGLQQDADTMAVTITRVYEGTPAEEAGLLNGDMIISADGVEAVSVELEQLVQHIRGEEGTFVTIEIFRPDTQEYLTFKVERRNVELPSVSSQMFENTIGYIQISEFQSGTKKQFWDAYQNLQEQGMQSLIVDVRANPGGLLSSVTEILDGILPEGLLVYTEDKYGSRMEFSSDAECIRIPMVVLVDGNSASAAEIFAGAIKDYEYGTLLGTKTFGKGIVQTIYPLSDGDAIKITTAKYFTPNGNYIHDVGIEPDIELAYEFLGGEEDTYSAGYDNQIQKAIELLKGTDTVQ